MEKGKNLLRFSLGIFLILEILFSFIISTIAFLCGATFTPLIYYFIPEQFFTNHLTWLFTSLIIEFLAGIGLFVWNIKFNSRNKLFLGVLFFLILLIIIFTINLDYSLTHLEIGF